MDTIKNSNIDPIVNKIICKVSKLCDTHNIFMLCINRENGTYRKKKGTGIFSNLTIKGNVNSEIISQAYQTKKIFIIKNQDKCQYFFSNLIVNKITYLALLPLLYKNEVIAFIGIASIKPEKHVAEDNFFLLLQYIDTAAITLGNALQGFLLRNIIITLKKEINRLNQSNETFFQAFQLLQNSVGLMQLDGVYVKLNEYFCKNVGYVEKELLGKTGSQIGLWLNDQDQDILLKEIETQQKINDRELLISCKNNKKNYASFAAQIIIINSKKYILFTMHNITQQKEALNQLELSKNKYCKMFLMSPDAIVIIRSDGILVEVNRGFTQMSGFSKEEAIGKTSVELGFWLQPNDRDQLLKRLLNTHDVQKIELPFKHKSGHIIYVQMLACNVYFSGESYFMAVIRDITMRMKADKERQQQQETIKHMAYFDFLTGLPNRYNLNKWLVVEMEQCRLKKTTGVVFFIDLDELKMVNETYGHTYGDKIIADSSIRIVKSFGKDAFIARISGDEFVVILPGKYTYKQIETIAHKITTILSQNNEYLGIRFHTTASIGIARYPYDGNTAEEIIKNADNAMFTAKKNGKNCWQFYNKEMQAIAYKKMYLIDGLRYAIERGELSLVYQPQIVIPQIAVRGFEALLRWTSHEYGNVPPSQFIPLAEQSDLIHSIGAWALREACFFAKRLTGQGQSEVRVAVNISARQISADDFIAIIHSAVKAAHIKPQQLEIEITESAFMTSMSDAVRKLTQLKEFGVHISLDDFGTGFSSLTYLRMLPFTTLKIDKSFVTMIGTNCQGAKTIDFIINLAQINSMDTIAEGVEKENQMKYLIGKGCNCIQGYLFSKPLAEAAAIQFLYNNDIHNDQ